MEKERMTKKRKYELTLEKKELEVEVLRQILCALGWDIDSKGYIIDQENFQKIKYKRRILKSKYLNETELISIHSNELIFDPFKDRGLVEFIFTTFLKKEQEDNGLYVKMYYPVQESNKIKIQTQIERISGETGILESSLYNMCNFAYIELIVGMSGFNTVKELCRIEEITGVYSI